MALRLNFRIAILCALALGAAFASAVQAAPPRLVKHTGPAVHRPHPLHREAIRSTGTLRDLLPYTATVNEVDFTFPDDPNPPEGEMKPMLGNGGSPDATRSIPPNVRRHPSSDAAKLLGIDVRMNDPAGDFGSTTNAETSIAAWGAYLVGGWNDGLHFGVAPGASGWAYSNDGGATWTDGGDLPLGCATCQYYGDPVLVVDGQGNFYFSNLYAPTGSFPPAGPSALSVNHGRFNGVGVMVWDPPVIVSSSPTDFLDKEWMAVDKECGQLYLSYTRFKAAGGQQIEFIRSTDGGVTWSAPLVLTGPDEYPQGSRPSVGPDHQVYVVYRTYDAVPGGTTHQRIQRSGDLGLTFGPSSDVDQATPGAQFYENITAPCGFNRAYMLELPSIDTDNSCNFRGRIYVAWPECVDYYDDPFQTGADVPEIDDVLDNTAAGAQPIAIGDHIAGTFSGGADGDYYSFAGIAGQTYEFTLFPGLGSSADGFLRMFAFPAASPLNRMALSYLGGGVAQIIFTVPSTGTYFIRPFPNSFAGGVQTYDLYTGVHTPSFLDLAGDHRDGVVAHSDDGGLTWSVPMRINDDPPLFDNSLPEVNVDGLGRVHFSWMDHRMDPVSGILADQRHTSSSDGTSSIDPSTQINTAGSVNWSGVASNLLPNFGDYAACATDGRNYYATWADGRSGNPDAWMRQVTGSLSLRCPPCPADSACPGDSIYYVYVVCNNSAKEVAKIGYKITANTKGKGGGTNCQTSGFAAVPPMGCVKIPFKCVVGVSPTCGKYDLTVNAQFGDLGTDKQGNPIILSPLCCNHIIHVHGPALLTAQNDPPCPEDFVALGCTSYTLNYAFCNTGECGDSVVCDIQDNQGWIQSTSITKGYLQPGECAVLSVVIAVPCDCLEPTADYVTVNCSPFQNLHSKCGHFNCATLVTCPGFTPVAVGNARASVDRGAVRISWTSFVDGEAAKFRVFRSLSAVGAFAPISDELNGSHGADMSFRDAGVRPGAEYFYKIGFRTGADWTYTGILRVKAPEAVFALRGARPNPFFGTTQIEYEIARAGEAHLDIFDVVGRRVRTLLSGRVESGIGTVVWDGRSGAGDRLSAGSYFARLSVGGRLMSQRIVLIR